MKLAFCIFRVFPHGGLSRDFVKIATACARRGHSVRAYARRWDSPAPAPIEMVTVPVKGMTNPARDRRFANWVEDDLKRRAVDLVVGFNKMPGLDVYFAGDSCFEEKARTQRPWAYRLLSRYRHFAEFERAVFDDDRQVKILTIAPAQKAAFQHCYGTVETRFFALPPDLDVERTTNPEDLDARRWLRHEFQLSDGDLALLFVGSGFIKKGLDRLLLAVAALPDALGRRTHLFILGEDSRRRFERLSARLAIGARVHFLGGRDDVPRFLHGADALALPAYDEAGGMVILEAIGAGLPVLATDVCGHAPHVLSANAGLVSASPFDQARFNSALAEVLTSPKREKWRENGRRYGASGALSGGTRTACDLIEGFGRGETRHVVAFCLHRFSASDPVSRDCMRIADACRAVGYHARVYAMAQEDAPEDFHGTNVSAERQRPGTVDPWSTSGAGPQAKPKAPAVGHFDVIVAPVDSMTDHKRIERFERWVLRHLQRNPVHCVVGFNKMPGLDLYIVTEPCAQREIERMRANLGVSQPIRLRDVFPLGSAARARQMLASERAVFDGTTKVLTTSPRQRDDYAGYYHIEPSIDEHAHNGDPASVVALIRQAVDARVRSPSASDPATPATPLGRLPSSGNGRSRVPELYLRDDMRAAWAGRDPFEVVYGLRGETYRVVKNRRTLRFVEGGAAYFAKVHDGVGWAEILKELCNLKSPVMGAQNEYAACRYLEARGIKAPGVAAFGRRGLNPARARSFVVCDALDGYVSLEDMTMAWPTDPPAPALRRRLVYAVADLAHSLHGAGVNHRDFYICHILANTAALSRGEVELAIIDLHRAQIRQRVPRRWVLRDLAALMFSTAHLGLARNDYLRFLARYTGRPLRTVLREDAAFLRRVRRRTDRLLAENQTRQVVGTHEKPALAVQEQT